MPDAARAVQAEYAGHAVEEIMRSKSFPATALDRYRNSLSHVKPLDPQVELKGDPREAFTDEFAREFNPLGN